MDVTARVDPARVDEITAQVDTSAHDTVLYARKDMRLTRTGTTTLAYGEDHVTYMVSGTGIEIVGTDPVTVASAACRLTREALRGRLVAAGWVLLHASAVVRDGRAAVAFGTKGSGKTAVALQLATATGGALLANDRVFARADDTGTVTVLPWPAAAAIGFGLLDAAGWYDAVATARDELHPSTISAVLDALATRDRTPIHQGSRELKPQLYPDQLTSLLGIPLATSGIVDVALFPSVNATSNPDLGGGGRMVGADDTFSGQEEDRYPNVFGLRTPEPDHARAAVFAALNALPKLTATLGHDIRANTDVLRKLD
ncbi:hypothetical protein [Amycolatopsis decaplanina]|uniref:HPr kinase n=1 Tax=Amycolatopsis decaplanina DSM 44594 TaxID=1284240 RepID=M2Y8D1_9PSEU|nr:hypothetical protein [Amycolatopsis decaplanina]EME51177.1 hypothetical protein H074_37068 [Amycolatopsis decaplanina DSM 44594]